MMEAVDESRMVRCCYNGTVTYIPVKLFQQMTARVGYEDKKFVRYKDGAEMYSMSEREFNKLAHDAKAVYKRNKMVLVKVDILDEFMEFYKQE